MPAIIRQVSPVCQREKKPTIVSIQFLRFIAAASVVLFHAYTAIALSFPYSTPDTFRYWFGFGAFGVHIFFCISGFVMSYTGFRTVDSRFDVKLFALRRIMRIYPIYWICAIMYVIFHLFVGIPYALSVFQIIGAVLLLPGYSPDIIGPAWTLSFEMYFYLCFAIFMMVGLFRGLSAMTVFFAVSIAIGLFLPRSFFTGVPTNFLLWEFVGGAWLGYAALRNLPIAKIFWLTALVTGFGMFSGGLLIDYRRIPAAFVWGIPSLFVVIGMVGWERTGHLPKIFSRLAILGDSSYFLYLIHVLLIDAILASPMQQVANSISGGVLLAFASSVFCCIVSVGAYRYIERPLQSRLKRWLPDPLPASGR